MTVVLTSVLTCTIVYMGTNYAINRFSQQLLGFFEKGIVKQGMSILGKKSGESRRNKSLENKIASGVIENTIGKWKLPLKIIGVDLDELLEEYEPLELLETLNTFLPLLKGAGVDITQLNPQSLISSGIGTHIPQRSNSLKVE